MKKLLSVLVLAILVTSIVFAGGAEEAPTTMEKEVVNLKVWASNEDQTMVKEMVEAFKAANPEKIYNIDFGVVSEADAKARYLEDPEVAADVFAFANDQLKDLVKSGALYQVSGKYLETVKAENGEGSVGSCTLDGKVYGFPMTADNGYFMYYDKSVFSEKDMMNLDTMLSVAQKAGKKVFMDLSNGWYVASFFLGAGCKLTIDENGKQVCDFNNEKGVAAGEAIKAFAANPAFMTGDDAVLTGGMGTSIAAGVSGTWNANAMKEILGENYGATKLPEFSLAGIPTQMSSFAGYKLIGVNKLTKHPVDALALGAWLTNESNQLKRFTTRGMGPSNSKVASSPEVLAAPELAALAQQGAYAVSQNDVLGNYWSPAEAFGAAMEAKDYSTSVKAQLDAMVAQIVQ